ncbi:MAG: WbqC family protein [Flavobacteriales bacterium]|nr:WbqC family protein [Flavobacteriales bacterium]
MDRLPLLAGFYFGSVEHYALLARSPMVLLDTGEHYMRQSYRTRTTIIGANGLQDLNVTIQRDSGVKQPMRSVGLCYEEDWPHQHMHAIRSAYGRSPWFLHFAEDIEQVLFTRYLRLVDLQLATLHLGLKWLRIPTEVHVSEEYVEGTEYHLTSTGMGPVLPGTPLNERIELWDLRSDLSPKRGLPEGISAVGPYHQVFQDRYGFQPRSSVIDLVCNMGPRATAALGR